MRICFAQFLRRNCQLHKIAEELSIAVNSTIKIDLFPSITAGRLSAGLEPWQQDLPPTIERDAVDPSSVSQTDPFGPDPVSNLHL
jgi:hypothetical protein